MVRLVHVAVFPMLHPIAVLFAFLREPDGTSLLRVDFYEFGFDAWVQAFPCQWRI